MKSLILILLVSSASFSGQLDYQKFGNERSEIILKKDTLEYIQKKCSGKIDTGKFEQKILEQLDRQSIAHETIAEDYHTNSLIGRTLLFIALIISIYSIQ